MDDIATSWEEIKPFEVKKGNINNEPDIIQKAIWKSHKLATLEAFCQAFAYIGIKKTEV